LAKLKRQLIESIVLANTRAKILASSPTALAIEVADLITNEIIRYPLARKAAEALNVHNSTIMNKINLKQ